MLFRSRYGTPNVIDARQHNLYLSQQDTFVEMAIVDLKRFRTVNTIRVHDSGDFYSQEYLNKWRNIAKTMPHITFYAYTKSLHLNFEGMPNNFKITQSLGGKYDNLVNLNMPHSRIFSSHDARINAGYIDGNVNDVPAIEGVRNIGLVYHGNKNMTESQKKYFA